MSFSSRNSDISLSRQRRGKEGRKEGGREGRKEGEREGEKEGGRGEEGESKDHRYSQAQLQW